MVKEMSQKMSEILVVNQIIEEADHELYVYGFETFIITTFNVLSILMIALVTGKVGPSIAFLITYCLTRQYTGGYHAKDYVRCYFTFIGMYMGILILNHYIMMQQQNILLVVLLIVSIVIIFIYAPLENRNNPLNKKEKIRYKQKARVLSIVFGFIGGLVLFLPYFREYGLYMIAALVAIASLLIIGHRREGK